jgi:hypothetical protein
MIMTTFLLDKNMYAKNIVDSIKLSIHLFQGGMNENCLETCEIEKLDVTSCYNKVDLVFKRHLKNTSIYKKD